MSQGGCRRLKPVVSMSQPTAVIGHAPLVEAGSSTMDQQQELSIDTCSIVSKRKTMFENISPKSAQIVSSPCSPSNKFFYKMSPDLNSKSCMLGISNETGETCPLDGGSSSVVGKSSPTTRAVTGSVDGQSEFDPTIYVADMKKRGSVRSVPHENPPIAAKPSNLPKPISPQLNVSEPPPIPAHATSQNTPPIIDKSKYRPNPPPRQSSHSVEITANNNALVDNSTAESKKKPIPLKRSTVAYFSDQPKMDSPPISKMVSPALVANVEDDVRQDGGTRAKLSNLTLSPPRPSDGTTAKLVNHALSPPLAPPKPPRTIAADDRNMTTNLTETSSSGSIYQRLSDGHSKMPYAESWGGDGPPNLSVAQQFSEPMTRDEQNTIGLHKPTIQSNKTAFAAAKSAFDVPETGNMTSSISSINSKRDHRAFDIIEPKQNFAVWETKFIRAPAKSQARRSAKEHFVSKNRMNNPCYMYATVKRHDDIIGRPLIRHRSDDNLLDVRELGHGVDSADIAPSVFGCRDRSRDEHTEGPIYHDPQSMAKTKAVSHTLRDGDTVTFDKEGYAIPIIRRGTLPQVALFINSGIFDVFFVYNF